MTNRVIKLGPSGKTDLQQKQRQEGAEDASFGKRTLWQKGSRMIIITLMMIIIIERQEDANDKKIIKHFTILFYGLHIDL